VRSGYVDLPITAGTLRYAGARGYNRSSRSGDIANAYYLRFDATPVFPSYGPYDRYIAFPLRCLSTVLGMGGDGCSIGTWLGESDNILKSTKISKSAPSVV